jgi:hypothetical protein
VLVQVEKIMQTPKALANVSPAVGATRQPWGQNKLRKDNAESVASFRLTKLVQVEKIMQTPEGVS